MNNLASKDGVLARDGELLVGSFILTLIMHRLKLWHCCLLMVRNLKHRRWIGVLFSPKWTNFCLSLPTESGKIPAV